MKAFICPRGGEAGKFLGVINAFPDIWKGRVLDVGCRSCKLKSVLMQHNSEIHYIGLDLYPPADVIANLEKGLPFRDKSFNVVVALDVLEHTDDIYTSFDELCRVARQFVVITLPNAYELRIRTRFLLGHPVSGKYGLPTEPPADRHRWLFSFRDARNFAHYRVQQCGFLVKEEGCLIGPRRANGVGKLLVSKFPDLSSPTYLCLLSRHGAGER